MSNGLLSRQQRLCRLCFTKQDDLVPIFDDEMPDLAEKIYDCTTVEINNIDGIPALICLQCRAKVVISSHFFGSWRNAVRKYRRLSDPQIRQHESKRRIESVESKPAKPHVEKSSPNVPVKTNGTVPVKPYVLDRLRNDAKLRRNSIDEDRKVDFKYVAKKRLSDESQVAMASMQLLAVKFEQSIKNEADLTVAEDGKKSCAKCGLVVHNLQEHKHKQNAKTQTVGKHVCGICNKTFSQRFLLNYHVNLHTGERPYKCKECDKSFTSPTNLYKHRQIHSGIASLIRTEDQRYHCNVCNCVFKHRKLIYKHMRTNHRERKFPCETCGKAYFTRDSMQKHMKLVHKKD